jgi:cyclopropane-fatty-acyl-phospholipid synthase
MYLWFTHQLLKNKINHGHLIVKYKDQEYSYGNPTESPQGILIVKNPRFFFRVLEDGEIGLGESYTANEWESPSINSLMLVLYANYKKLLTSRSNHFLKKLLSLKKFFSFRKGLSFSQADSQVGMSVSYDVGNEFFSYMLGKSMLYTCAFFKNKQSSLDEAQSHKLDVIIQKLQPSSEHKVLDIGCGWGTLLNEIHKRHGSEVRGIALAQKQIQFCKEKHPFGTFDYLDYRDLKEENHYDRVVSVGMMEHIGKEYLQNFFDIVKKVLKPNGRALLHLIIKGSGYDESKIEKDQVSYGYKHIIPVAYFPTDQELVQGIYKTKKLRVIHQEKFGVHYAETNRRWAQNILNHANEIQKIHPKEIISSYEYTWASMSAAFSCGFLDLFQIVVEKSPLSLDAPVYDPRAEKLRNSEQGHLSFCNT